jgi:hypothetical protein
MTPIEETSCRTSPITKPQSLAWDGVRLWVGSRDTKVICSLDPVTWTKGWQTTAPGTPYGMTVVSGELRVLCGEAADDNRIIRRCIPGQGFDGKFALPCPDDTGSQLSHDGQTLVVSQWYPKKLIALGADGQAGRIIEIPHGICGQTCLDGCYYLITTDAEQTTDYWLTRVDPRPAVPIIHDIAHVPFAARALAFDGKQFWTNHREQNQIVSFERPD